MRTQAANLPIKVFVCDLNWSKFDSPVAVTAPSTAFEWAEIDAREYFDWHIRFGNNAVFCQAYTFGGYAFYPTKHGPVAPGAGSSLIPRLFDLAHDAGVPFWSYFCVGADCTLAGSREHWLVPGSRALAPQHGFLAPETPWTDLLCERVAEFLTHYPADWLLFDWFVYGSLKPDIIPPPAWYMEKPFAEIIGRPMPQEVSQITAEEGLRYKREVLARQFRRIRDTVRSVSPSTKIGFNVPYWEPAEPLWIDHPMLAESDYLFAESSDSVVEWLLEVRKPHQRVMTTVIGRTEGDVCDPGSWRRWHDRGCDLFGYAFATPPNFRPHPAYHDELEVVRRAFAEIG